MIDFNVKNDRLFNEGIIEDSLKKAADIDIGEIRSNWQNSQKGIVDKLSDTNDQTLGKLRKKADDVETMSSKHLIQSTSIVARARNSVLQFPIYVPQTIRINVAHIIGKMFERVYATLVQTVLSQNPIMDEDEANNLVFLRKYHTNIREAADTFVNQFYQPIDNVDRMLCESVFYTHKLTENCTVEFRVVPCNDQDLIKENARLLNEPLTGLTYLSEGSKEEEAAAKALKATSNVQVNKERSVSLKTVNDDEIRDIAMNRENFSNTERKIIKQSASDIEKDLGVGNGGKADKDDLDEKLKEKEAAEQKLHSAVEKTKKDIKDGKVKDYKYRDGRFVREERQNKDVHQQLKKTDIEQSIDAPKLLKDGDIKKFNGLLPWTIEASFRIKTKQGLDRDVHYIIGIKSVLHLFRTQDLADDLRELVTGNVRSLQKIRYKTGEINFLDYFLNIKGLKADAAKHINYDKRWLNTLKRLGEYEKMNGTFLKKPTAHLTNGQIPIPNGTLVLSQPDVTSLTNSTGIDLSVVSNAKRLAKTLFLIAIVIVDSSAGTMRVLFTDTDSEWDVQSLAAIDAEISKTDNSQLMKELNHMVNK